MVCPLRNPQGELEKGEESPGSDEPGAHHWVWPLRLQIQREGQYSVQESIRGKTQGAPVYSQPNREQGTHVQMTHLPLTHRLRGDQHGGAGGTIAGTSSPIQSRN